MGFNRRLFVLFVLLSAGTVLLSALAGYAFARGNAIEYRRQELEETLRLVRGFVPPDEFLDAGDGSAQPAARTSGPDPLLRLRSALPGIMRLYVLQPADVPGGLRLLRGIGTSAERAPGAFFAALPVAAQGAAYQAANQGQTAAVAQGTHLAGFAPLRDEDGHTHLLVGFELSPTVMEHRLDLLAQAFAGLALVLLIPCLYMSYLGARGAARPVERLAAQVAAMYQTVGTPVPARSGGQADELDRIAAYYGRVTTELKSSRDSLERLLNDTIAALAGAVDAKDGYTAGHSKDVSDLAVAVGQILGMDAAAVERLRLAGLLHDIGKIGVPDAVLNKHGPLTPEEREVMQSHATMGRRILEKVHSMNDVARIVYHHHERFDGLGYPSGIAGETIPLESRIIAVVDAFHAMTSDRVYRKGMDPQVALGELSKGRGVQFDPRVVDALTSWHRQRLLLDTGRLGAIPASGPTGW